MSRRLDNSPVDCLLCQSDEVSIVNTIPTKTIITGWRSRFDIDVEPEMDGCTSIDTYQCQVCRLRFFSPELAGSDELYTKLQSFNWYYMPRKWEHDAAVQDMRKDDLVLEVGCGPGHFVGRLLRLEQMKAVGIELNRTAVNRAKNSGRPVFFKEVKDMALNEAGKFDVVCSFQVLEHVPDPKQFIGACIALLKPGGQLLISVPNSAGFIRLAKNDLLNQPPHHMTQWSRPVLENLPKLFPLKLHRILHEPLAPYHFSWYVNLQLSRLPRVGYATAMIDRCLRKLIVPIAWRAKLNQFLRGHTIYAAYEKL